jgi:hypothetical protein
VRIAFFMRGGAPTAREVLSEYGFLRLAGMARRTMTQSRWKKLQDVPVASFHRTYFRAI